MSVFNYAENEPVGHIDLWGLQKESPPVGAVIGGNIRAAYEQLKYSIWRNWQKDRSSIPYRTYGVEINEYTGEAYVAFKEYPVEPPIGQRLLDNTLAGLDLVSVIPKGSGVQTFAKAPGWWPFARGLASKSELLADGGKCESCARLIQESIGGSIVKLENNFLLGKAGIGLVKDQSGLTIVDGNTWKEHFAVFKDGKYYDGLTGPGGMKESEYSKLFGDWEFLKKTIIDEK